MADLRILYISDRFWPYIGGVEVVAARLLPALVRRGHAAAVVTVHGGLTLPDDAEFSGVEVHRFRLAAGAPLEELACLTSARARFRRLVATFRPDVIHLNGVPSTAFALLTPPLAGDPPLIVSLHGMRAMHTGQMDAWSARALERAVWVTACSQVVLDSARRAVPAIAARSSLQYGLISPPTLDPSPLPFDPPKVLAVARLDHEKGLDLLIDAAPILHARHPRVRIVIAGDGEARADLTARIARLGLSEQVTLRGWVAPGRIWGLLNTATVVAIPSRTEGFGLIALEAAAMARPVVAARVGGLVEAVDAGRSGVLVEPGSAAALADGIGFLLDHPDDARAMGACARARVVVRHDEGAALDAHEALYRQVAGLGTRRVAS
jgi:glycosyltransferase involved in cell wall biosynthesis